MKTAEPPYPRGTSSISLRLGAWGGGANPIFGSTSCATSYHHFPDAYKENLFKEWSGVTISNLSPCILLFHL